MELIVEAQGVIVPLLVFRLDHLGSLAKIFEGASSYPRRGQRPELRLARWLGEDITRGFLAGSLRKYGCDRWAGTRLRRFPSPG